MSDDSGTTVARTHTPGPWHSEYEFSPSTVTLRVVGGGRIITGGIRDDADARLIAAAPALLEACARALAVEQSVTQGQERELRAGYVALLRAALAKAAGA